MMMKRLVRVVVLALMAVVLSGCVSGQTHIEPDASRKTLVVCRLEMDLKGFDATFGLRMDGLIRDNLFLQLVAPRKEQVYLYSLDESGMTLTGLLSPGVWKLSTMELKLKASSGSWRTLSFSFSEAPLLTVEEGKVLVLGTIHVEITQTTTPDTSLGRDLTKLSDTKVTFLQDSEALWKQFGAKYPKSAWLAIPYQILTPKWVVDGKEVMSAELSPADYNSGGVIR